MLTNSVEKARCVYLVLVKFHFSVVKAFHRNISRTCVCAGNPSVVCYTRMRNQLLLSHY